MNDQEKIDMLALSMVPGVGPLLAKRILEHAGSPSVLFKMPPSDLRRIPDIGPERVKGFFNPELHRKAERELKYVQQEGLRMFCLNEPGYPGRLKPCPDAPLVMYLRGEADLDVPAVLAVVGTRRASRYGLAQCRRLITSMAEHQPDMLVLSGLAYGIDHAAHQASLEAGLRTVAILGHGLKFLYPASHRRLAEQIETQGALVTDFPSDEGPIPQHFIKRNRLIAGLSDAVVVVESGLKGGALITAGLAASYDRDVFAIPGRVEDRRSAGCNFLIKTHQAAMIENADDLAYFKKWSQEKARAVQQQLFPLPEERAQRVIRFLDAEGRCSIDRIADKTGMPVAVLSAIVLELELGGWLRALPGDCYELAL